MFEPVQYDYDDEVGRTLIKVVGVGGGGGNAINYMVEQLQNHGAELASIDSLTNDEHGEIIFYAVNTDAQALRKSKVQQTVQIGAEVTRGLGAGANPNVGQKAAEEDRDAIRLMLEGANMVFIATGMGGGTGTGAAPIVAQVAKELGILTVAVVTKPFSFEGKKRMSFAEQGIKALSQYVDSLIVIPNDKLKKVLPKGASLIDAFAAVNNVLRNAVTGISDMITTPGMINVDFADVRTVMSEMGRAMMGTGIAQGETDDGRAEKAANEAVASPLLEDVDLSGARGVIVNILSGLDLSLDEYEIIGNTIKSFASEEATVVVGTSLNPEMQGEIRVTLVATGIGANEELAQLPPRIVRPDVLHTETHLQAGQHVQPTQPEIVQQPSGPAVLDTNNRFIPGFLRDKNNH
ncbi:cell division protein FtsZ [Actinobacillus porcinus]|uniref:cell division protein FtsZ n=1 Tax=Actinobacillus porcinus TaxID=51048 RepID=UPI002357D692|nr:cell division protein FtsZ [Actinobacillus porcinus]MDD7545942.1 cell division protein FtsZ [Actinobacillus porcinus]MDY5848448.1 cell division protein FtsZ [Actinobacillus porcinus]